jgi:DNA-binding XRE family transcriptional regulator
MTKNMTIKELRKQKLRMTQEEMGKAMGVTRRTIARYEATGAPPQALKLANFILKSRRIT